MAELLSHINRGEVAFNNWMLQSFLNIFLLSINSLAYFWEFSLRNQTHAWWYFSKVPHTFTNKNHITNLSTQQAVKCLGYQEVVCDRTRCGAQVWLANTCASPGHSTQLPNLSQTVLGSIVYIGGDLHRTHSASSGQHQNWSVVYYA